MTADPFRNNPETCAIASQSAAARRRTAAVRAARAHRPHDQHERQAIHEAHARYAEVHGAFELHGLLSSELGRYAPPLPPRAHVQAVERLFKREARST